MGYNFSLYKNIKKIEGSEGSDDEPINPETGEEYDCVQIGDSWFLFDEVINQSSWNSSFLSDVLEADGDFDYWEEFSNKGDVSVGFLEMMKRVDSFPVRDESEQSFVSHLKNIQQCYEKSDAIIFE